jgi:hypothetical protein
VAATRRNSRLPLLALSMLLVPFMLGTWMRVAVGMFMAARTARRPRVVVSKEWWDTSRRAAGVTDVVPALPRAHTCMVAKAMKMVARMTARPTGRVRRNTPVAAAATRRRMPTGATHTGRLWLRPASSMTPTTKVDHRDGGLAKTYPRTTRGSRASTAANIRNGACHPAKHRTWSAASYRRQSPPCTHDRLDTDTQCTTRKVVSAKNQ